jgi:hypothetical protein
VFLSDGSSKTPEKAFHKKIVSKILYKKVQNHFFLDLFYHVFGRCSVRGVQKHHKKNPTINLTLLLFWPLTHPPTTGDRGHRFFVVAGPLFAAYLLATSYMLAGAEAPQSADDTQNPNPISHKPGADLDLEEGGV